MKYLTIIFLFISCSGFGQSARLTKIIDKIDYQNDTLLAVYNWVTDNVKYDVSKAKSMKKGENGFKKGGYKTIEEYKSVLLEKVIKSKKGVCEDYALLFNSIVTELGYTSHVVSGITKNKVGNLNSSLGHAWNAVRVNGTWKLYDTTWGAGVVKNNKKFVKKYNARWNDTSPEEMIKRHFPFDPIWQISADPLTFKEFKKGSKITEGDGSFAYAELIDNFLQKDKNEKYAEELSRLEKIDGKNSIIRKRLEFLKRRVNQSNVPDIMNNCRAAGQQFSDYYEKGKNKKFKGPLWTKDYAKKTLLEIQQSVIQSNKDLKGIKTKDARNKKSVRNVLTQNKDLLRRLEKELIFLQG